MEDKVQETLQSQIHQMEAEYEQMERQEILDSIRKKRADFLDMFHHEVQKKKQENSQRSEEWECQIRRQKETCKE